ncbi:MAG: DUF5110 domain-containing protein [Bacteroidaceae bacterium]|nr:DUF5110 domain-containing protein [Bacteroidaceae bacterium]
MRKKLIFMFAAFAALAADAQNKVKIDFITPSIVRVQWSPNDVYQDNATGVCVYAQEAVQVSKAEKGAISSLSSSELIVEIDNQTNAVTFKDKATGRVLLSEAASNFINNGKCTHESERVVQERVVYDEKTAHTENTANGQVTVKDAVRRDTIGLSNRIRTYFNHEAGEAMYGLGAHMEDYMNLRGKTMYLTQHNLKAMVPMLCSTNGYGIMFDAGCAMKYESSSTQNGSGWYMQFEAAKEMDYYFIKGENFDKIIAGYHHLTGKVSMMPRYVFGYTQSKERYVSSDDIIRTLKEYRRRSIPIDMIVQDWNYWPQGWGYMKMNPKYYPNPAALADSVHSMDAKLMISIWPNPQWCPEAEDFKKRGFMLEHDVYDVFSVDARKHYWSYANDEFFSKGFDAWWCDSSEPLDGDWNQLPPPVDGKQYGWDDHERRWNLNKDVLSDALGAERSSLYSLYHSMGIYENQRATTSDKRVVNLTRSTYAGQQRYGTIVWNGDTHASWKSFRQQIPAGLNYMVTGNPYWTVDVGSFFTRNNSRSWFYKGEFPNGVKDDNYKEYYTRMFQWGAFLPMLRSHGSDTPREIWQFGEPGSKYYDAILSMIEFRYQLVPYIYSMAAMQTINDYTMARMLAFDFASDANVLDIKDEYMFGDFLVCPVTSPLSETAVRKVYLPKGEKWIDCWTDKQYEGGQWIDYRLDNEAQGFGSIFANVGNAKNNMYFPLFVKAGSILPMCRGNYKNAVEQREKPIEIRVIPGKDAEFILYEDEGDNYNFEKGEYSSVKLTWNDKKKTLTIGERQGEYSGMEKNRLITVTNSKSSKSITYKGKKVAVSVK